jgi:dipeptidyl aminopeptidase/acylaminoacyl peptidase
MTHKLVAVFMLAAFAAPASAPAAAPPEGALVTVGIDLFSGRDYTNDGIFVVNADGTGMRQLTHDISDEDPHWSPDGTLIAFSGRGERTRTSAVVVIAPDGSGRRVLGAGDEHALSDSAPWAPAGDRLAWAGCGGLCIFDFATGRTTRIRVAHDVGGLVWSPDGATIAATTDGGKVVLIASDGRKTRVAATGDFADSPTWAPDGTRLAFVSEHNVELVPAAPGPVTTLARGVDGPLHWSPDGRSILGIGRGGPTVVDVQTGRVASIPVTEAAGGGEWSPDGSAVATVRGRVGWRAGDLWIVTLDGGAPRRVTTAFPTGDVFGGGNGIDLDWTARRVDAKAAPSLLAPPAAARLAVPSVDALSAFGPRGGVVVGSDVLCSYDAETFAAFARAWTPPSRATPVARGPCGNYGDLGESWAFAGGRSLVAWLTSVIVDVQQSDRDVVAVARPGDARGTVRAQWQSIRYNTGLGRVDDFPVLLGDGTSVAFEGTWRNNGRALWRVDERSPGRPVRIPLPRDATTALAEDRGQIVLATTHEGLVVVDGRGHVRRRIGHAPADQAALGGDQLAVRSGDLLTVFATDGRARRFVLASDSGAPRLLAVRNGLCVYASGIAIHVLRLADGVDRVLALPDESGPVDAVATARGLYVSYDRGYSRPAGQVLLFDWASLR